jgi:hypothetical protein
MITRKKIIKHLTSAALITFTALYSVSCAASQPQPDLSGSSAKPTSLSVASNPAVEAARQALDDQLSLSGTDIKVTDVEQVQWPDGCLGLQPPGVMCAMHVVPGYQITLQADQKIFQVRTNLDGSQVSIDNNKSPDSLPTSYQPGKISPFRLQISGFPSLDINHLGSEIRASSIDRIIQEIAAKR